MKGKTYSVDIVMCIDCTGSMAGIMNTVKANALKFCPDLLRVLEAKDRYMMSKLRIKVIAYRDFYFDGAEAINESSFFTLPDQQTNFQSFVNGLVSKGGGDEPQSGLEALALAIRSDWNKSSDIKREVIIIYTNASAHPLDSPMAKPSNYPIDMPKNFDELTDWWEGQDTYVSQSAQRLIIFAPDAKPWSGIASEWENTIYFPSKAGEGLKELDYEAIPSVILFDI